MSTTSTTGQPARSSPRDGVSSGPAASASSDGHGEVSTHGTPARRARSSATSRACHVGACSCWWTSSCSSTTTTAASAPTGAQAAARVPTTVAPAAPSAQSRGWAATRTPARRKVRPTAAATGAVGHRTRVWPRRAAATATTPGSIAGGSRTTAAPPPERVLGQAVERVTGAARDAGGRTGGRRRQTGDVALGRGGAQERRRTTRPAPGRPPGEVDEVGPGPRPDHLASGRRSTPAGGSTPTSTTHPPTRRGPQGDPHPVPDAHLAPERVGDQVVEGLVDGGLVDEDPHDLPAGAGVREGKLGLPSRAAHSPNADLMSSTRVVCSQVSSLSLRPK